MENTDRNDKNQLFIDQSKYTADHKFSYVIKSDSNELNNELCCSKNDSDIKDVALTGKNTSINVNMNDVSRESSKMRDSKYEVQNSDLTTEDTLKKAPMSEVHTYSTELTEDNKDSHNNQYQNAITSSPKNTESLSNYTFQNNKSISSPIVNLQRGAFGSVARPPRPSASFCRLDVSTDLNLPPSNWLNVDPSCLPPGLAGFDATPHYSGFSSFRMASLFLDYSSRQR